MSSAATTVDEKEVGNWREASRSLTEKMEKVFGSGHRVCVGPFLAFLVFS